MGKKAVFIVAVVFALALPVIVLAIDLPVTGQTTSYATGDEGIFRQALPGQAQGLRTIETGR